MPFANSTGRDINHVAESTFAQIPSTPAFEHMRTTGGSLNLGKTNRTSNEIRSDRQISKLLYGSERVEGDLSFDLSYGSFDSLLEMALMGNWSSNVLKVDTDLKFRTFEEHHADIGQYIRSSGCSVNTLNLSITPDEVTGSFGILGKTQETAASAIVGSSYGATNTNDVVDGFSGSFQLDSSDSAIITQLDLSLTNNLELRQVLGGAPIEHKYGQSNLTGTITAYFENLALYNKFVNEQALSLQAALTDGTNTLTILLPEVMLTEPDRPVDGDSDILLNLPFQAIYNPTEQSNIVISR